MCKSPIRIPNPKRDFDPDIHQQYIYVPCGKCSDCRKKQRDEWFPRLIEEFHNFQDKGSIWFPTLTYDNEHLPWFEDQKRKYKIPCFKYKDIQTFTKLLRVYFTRLGKDCNGMKYFVASEYGSKTGRPHYHALIYLPFKISPIVATFMFRKSWTHGFVGSSKKGMEILGVDAIAYCSKYVNKDQVYEHKYKIPQYLKSLLDERKKIYNLPLDSPVRKNNLESISQEISNFRKVTVRHYQSTLFGKTLKKKYLTPDGVDIDKLIENKLEFSGVHKKFGIPQYILRDFLFDKVWTHIEYDGLPQCTEEPKLMYVLNDTGKIYYKKKFDKLLYDTRQHLKCFFDRNVMQSLHIPTNQSSPLEVCNHITNLLNNRPLELLTIYSTCYENKRLTDFENIDYDIYTKDFIIDNAFDIWLSAKELNINILYPTSAYKCNPSILKNEYPKYNELPIFKDFDEILDFIRILSNNDSVLRSYAVFKNELDNVTFKELYQHYSKYEPLRKKKP